MFKFLVLALALVATPALASGFDKAQATVTIEWAHRPKDKLVADFSLWRCAANKCQGWVTDRPHALSRICRRLARAGGRIAAFELPRGPLSETELAQCNQGLNGWSKPAK